MLLCQAAATAPQKIADARQKAAALVKAPGVLFQPMFQVLVKGGR